MNLLSFEDSALLKRWVYSRSKGEQTGISFSSDFTLNESNSIRLSTQAWVPGANEWPLWRLDGHFPSDWSAYDRIVIDFVNPTDDIALVGLKIADEEMSKLATSNWRAIKRVVPPRSHLRVIAPLSELMKGLIKELDQSNLRTLLIYATRPQADFDLHISSAFLVKPNKKIPAIPDGYQKAVRALRLEPLIEKGRVAVSVLPKDDPRAADLKKSWLAMEAILQDHGTDLEAVTKDSEALIREIRRSPSLVALRKAAEGQGYAVAWANSAAKILPREMPIEAIHLGDEAKISTARRESESVQVVVFPLERSLKNVRVKAGAFTNEKGDQLASKAINISPVGFVKTERPAYDVSYVGWWPDPLLSYLESVDIAVGDAQSFWVAVRPQEDQAAGTYHGELTISADGVPDQVRKLTVQVRNFILPALPPIDIAIPAPMAVSFKGLTDTPWEELKYQWADFQAEYYLGWDNLYVKQAPDWEVLEYLNKRGLLARYILYPIGFGGGVERPLIESGKYNEILEKTMASIEPIYAEAKERGLLEKAYFYGMDELPTRYFPALRKIAARVKGAYPDLELVSTAADYSYGIDSAANEIDTWVPLIHEYDPIAADQARERGKKIWWYNCKTPAHPYPNQFTEYPLMDLRIMHGAMTAKLRPEGFLYYSVLRVWSLPNRPARKVIESGPFTEWDPCAMAFSPDEPYNGEGYLVYPGPKGAPLSSVRLENFRDGLEDLWYWKLLDEKLSKARSEANPSAATNAWITKASDALVVPPELVESSSKFTRDLSELYQWRDQLATLIETAPSTL